MLKYVLKYMTRYMKYINILLITIKIHWACIYDSGYS